MIERFQFLNRQKVRLLVPYKYSSTATLSEGNEGTLVKWDKDADPTVIFYEHPFPVPVPASSLQWLYLDGPEPVLGINPSAPGPAEVGDLLRDAASTYEDRDRAYGSSYKTFGKVMALMFPEGLHLKTARDFNRFAVFMHTIGKPIRYAANFTKGGHDDSLRDTSVYATMLRSLDRDQEEAAE
jgi:hypothetical protein